MMGTWLTIIMQERDIWDIKDSYIKNVSSIFSSRQKANEMLGIIKKWIEDKYITLLCQCINLWCACIFSALCVSGLSWDRQNRTGKGPDKGSIADQRCGCHLPKKQQRGPGPFRLGKRWHRASDKEEVKTDQLRVHELEVMRCYTLSPEQTKLSHS